MFYVYAINISFQYMQNIPAVVMLRRIVSNDIWIYLLNEYKHLSCSSTCNINGLYRSMHARWVTAQVKSQEFTVLTVFEVSDDMSDVWSGVVLMYHDLTLLSIDESGDMLLYDVSISNITFHPLDMCLWW